MEAARHLSPVANYQPMNFTQMHERLRQEMWRRVQRGTLSVSLLARQTGLAQSHASHFLHSKRRLSLDALDRILAAQRLTARDLLPAAQQFEPDADEAPNAVPIVSHAAALFEPFIRSTAAQGMVHMPAGVLRTARARTSSPRRSWERFVAVRVQAADAAPMEPLILPDAIALLDRHYNSLTPYRTGRPTLFAVRNGAHLTLRYVDFLAGRLVLRPHNIAFPVELIEIDPSESPNDLLAGRVALIVNEV
jgi:transcriptional regulator with XRE-family HTH domain